MKRLLIALTLVAAATALRAQTATTSSVAPHTFSPTSALPDYRARAETSELPTFVINSQRGQPKHNTVVRIGLLAPLPGSVPTTTSVMPDAFALLRTEYPWRKGLRPGNR